MRVRSRFIVRATVAYAVATLGWLLLSGNVLHLLRDSHAARWFVPLNATVFVAATATLLFLALRAVPERGTVAGRARVVELVAASAATTRLSRVLVYALAALVSGAVLVVRLAIDAGSGEHPLLTLLMLPVALAGLVGGLGPGLVATTVAVAGAAWLLLPPFGSFVVADMVDALELGILAVCGVVVSLLGEGLRGAQRESETRRRLLDAIIEGTPDSIFVKDRAGRYALINVEASRLIGRTPAQVLGQDDRALFPAPVAEALMARDSRVRAGGRVVVSEDAVTTVDGPQTHLTVSGPLRGPRGEIAGTFGIARDVTAQRVAEREREVLRARVAQELEVMTRLRELSLWRDDGGGTQALVEASLDAAIAFAAADFGHVQYMDPRSGRLRIVAQRGFKAEFLVHFADFAPFLLPGGVPRALATGESVSVPDVLAHAPLAGTDELDVVRAAGVRALHSTPLLSLSGQLVGRLTVHFTQVHEVEPLDAQHLALLGRQLSDLVERTRALQALADSEERLRLARSVAGIGIFEYQSGGDELHCDAAVRAAWGCGEDALSLEDMIAAVEAPYRDAFRHLFERATGEAGSIAECEVALRPADGQAEAWYAVAAMAFPRNGGPARVVGTVRDITRARRMEREQQVRRAELDTLLRQQVAVHTAAAIAHELNQPLNAISAYGEAALDMLDSGNRAPERLRQAIERGVAQAQRAGESVHELLEFLQRRDVDVAPFDLDDTARAAVRIVVAERFGEFQPTLELAGNLPQAIGNRAQIEKVLINLLHNGIDAMRQAGLAAGQIAISVATSRDADMALVSVRDSGPGVSEELARRIFEPFFSTKTDGMGLGLSISRALVEANGGHLWCEHDDKPGAVFRFTVPLKR